MFEIIEINNVKIVWIDYFEHGSRKAINEQIKVKGQISNGPTKINKELSRIILHKFGT